MKKVRLRVWFRNDQVGTDYFTRFPKLYTTVLKLFNTIRAWKTYDYPTYKVLKSWNIRDNI